MRISLHSDQSLVLVLRGQDHFVFIHLLASVGGADDGYLTTDAEPAGRSQVSPARLKRSRAGFQQPGQAPSVPTADSVTFTLDNHLQKSAPAVGALGNMRPLPHCSCCGHTRPLPTAPAVGALGNTHPFPTAPAVVMLGNTRPLPIAPAVGMLGNTCPYPLLLMWVHWVTCAPSHCCRSRLQENVSDNPITTVTWATSQKESGQLSAKQCH